MNDMNGNSNKNTDNNQEMGGFARAVEFCKRNVQYIAVAGLFIVLVIVLVNVMGGKGTGSKPKTETEAVVNETETQEAFEKDAYPEINELIENYYNAYAGGKKKKLAKLAEPMSDTEKSYIAAFSEYVKKYKNISCYTKKGLDDNSYMVSVYLEIKFNDIKTAAPGLETFYVRKREDGTLYIDNLYGQFNSKRQEFEVDEDVVEFIKEFNQQEDVVALETEVQQKYEAALAADEDLKAMAETTVPTAMAAWRSDELVAAKKAEDEKAAAEEAAKKAAEEEAAKKAEEEKRAAELASAVTVYATDNVNVRAEASETAEILGKLETGSKTTRLEEKDGWSRIDYTDGKQGYVKSEYLSTEAPSADAPAEEETPEAASSNGFAEGTVITIKESVNIRKSMGEDAEKIATAFAGEKVTVIMSYAEGWTKVTYGDKTGFIKTELLQ